MEKLTELTFMELELNKTQMSHLRMLVDDRMRNLEKNNYPSADLMSLDIEYSQLLEIDQILSHLTDEEDSDK
jgi:hypothetical protein